MIFNFILKLYFMEDNMRERQFFSKKGLFNLGIPVCKSSVSQSQLSIITNYIDMVCHGEIRIITSVPSVTKINVQII